MSKTIVFIHGMWGTGSFFDDFKKPFEQAGYVCLTPTLRYHDTYAGGTPDVRLSSTSITDFVEDIRKVIAGIDNPILIGWSLGGLIAEIVASTTSIEKMILLTSAPRHGTNYFRLSMLYMFLPLVVRYKPWQKPYLPPFHFIARAMFNCLPKAAQAKTYGRFVYDSGRAAAEIGFSMFDHKKASAVDLKAISAPVLFAVGKEDHVFTPALARRSAAKYGRPVEVREFEGHGHLMVMEPGWEAVAKDLIGWLAE